MCGIIGIFDKKNLMRDLSLGMKYLEYRGYDSSGVCLLTSDTCKIIKAKGKFKALEKDLENIQTKFTSGIGHTRWATHGACNDVNAHPFEKSHIVGVHNGIVDNYKKLKANQENNHTSLVSDTDSEVAVSVYNHYAAKGKQELEEFIIKSFDEIQGSNAFLLVDKNYPDTLIGINSGRPLCFCFGVDGNFAVSSDPSSIVNISNKIYFLEKNEFVYISENNATVKNKNGEIVEKVPVIISDNSVSLSKGNYRHFMLKEINEQSEKVSLLFSKYLDFEGMKFKNLSIIDSLEVKRIKFIACGSALNAAHLARHYFFRYSKVTAELESASEFRYNRQNIMDDTLYVFISQSGETADTIAALEKVKEQSGKCLSLVNNAHSSLARLSDYCLEIYAEAEISVAATKTFLNQATLLIILALKIGVQDGSINKSQLAELFESLMSLPRLLSDIINMSDEIKKVSNHLHLDKNIIFIGRGVYDSISIEAALKFTEVSYINSTSYASGELKHGPIALIDDNLPVIALCPAFKNDLFEKNLVNLHEISNRGENIIIITDQEGKTKLQNLATLNYKYIVAGPDIPFIIQAVAYTVPMQLLAYYTALKCGTDIDQPRNLAKSVTVE